MSVPQWKVCVLRGKGHADSDVYILTESELATHRLRGAHVIAVRDMSPDLAVSLGQKALAALRLEMRANFSIAKSLCCQPVDAGGGQ